MVDSKTIMSFPAAKPIIGPIVNLKKAFAQIKTEQKERAAIAAKEGTKKKSGCPAGQPCNCGCPCGPGMPAMGMPGFGFPPAVYTTTTAIPTTTPAPTTTTPPPLPALPVMAPISMDSIMVVEVDTMAVVEAGKRFLTMYNVSYDFEYK